MYGARNDKEISLDVLRMDCTKFGLLSSFFPSARAHAKFSHLIGSAPVREDHALSSVIVRRWGCAMFRSKTSCFTYVNMLNPFELFFFASSLSYIVVTLINYVKEL